MYMKLPEGVASFDCGGESLTPVGKWRIVDVPLVYVSQAKMLGLTEPTDEELAEYLMARGRAEKRKPQKGAEE